MKTVTIKKKLVIEGEKVHNVGYRLFLMDLADDFLLTCFSAKNKVKEGKQIVEVLAGGKRCGVEKFISLAKKEYPPNSKVAKVSDYDYDEDIRSIESFSRSFSTSQLAKIAGAGVSMLGKQDTAIDLQKHTLGKQDQMLDKQDQMLGKQDQMVEKQDQLLGKQDQMVEKQNKNTEVLSGKLDNIHNDLSEKQDKTIKILTETKSQTVQRSDKLDKSFHSFHQDTVNRFDVVDAKYGKIAENMENIFMEMKEERVESRKSMEHLIGAVLKVAEKK